MNAIHQRRRTALAALAAVLTLAACAEEAPVAPELETVPALEAAAVPAHAALNKALAAMRRASARYHDIALAIEDGFVQVHGCEEREGGAPPVGIPFADPSRFDGVIDPSQPEALLYEPGEDGEMKLVGVELVIPYSAWTGAEPPEFFGAQFQPEDEFGVWGLHVWIWRHNPDGMFAPGNVNIRCEAGE